MLQLGIRGHDTPEGTFEERVKFMSEAGFCCTQLALSKLISDFNVTDEAMTSGMALHIKRVFEKYNVEVSVLGCYKNISCPEPVQLKEIMKSYENHIRFASLLGCGMVGTETGAVNVEYRYTPENHTPQALLGFIENLKRVVEYAEKMGVCFGIEPVYKHIMHDIESTRKVLSAVNSPNLRVILDPVNLLSLENESKHEEIIKGAFELFGNEIDVIHLKDYVVKDIEIVSRPLTLGDGKLNIPYLMGLVKQKKPWIHVLLEDSVPDNAQASREYAAKCYHQAK